MPKWVKDISVQTTKYTVQRSTVMSYNILLHVSVHTNHHQELHSHWKKHREILFTS